VIFRFVFCILSVFSFSVYASEKSSSSIVYSAVDNTKSASSVAEMWGLTETDIHKYNLIMKGPRGIFSPDIAPPLALALEESNHVEKTRYLTIYAKLEYDRTRKDLETSRMYDKIFKKLFTEPVINNSILFKDKEKYIQAGDRFVVFIDSACTNCKSKLLLGLMQTSNFPKNPTDIFVKGLSHENELHAWATENSIRVEDVQDGKVTLNLIQEETIPVMNAQGFLIYVLRNNSLFSFSN